MPSNYAAWPFRSTQARSLEETTAWWSDCYVENTITPILVSQPHWRVITGKTGGGKSVTLAALERKEANNSFVVYYPPERWPGSRHAWIHEGNHLAQIMTAATLAIRDYLTLHTEKVAELSTLQQEFLRWLMEKLGGARAFFRWVNALDQVLAGPLKEVPQENLYPTYTDPLDVQGQIDELASLVRTLGFERVLVITDLNSRGSQIYLHDLQTLFEWLELTHHPGLALAAAIPLEMLEQGEIIHRARGRVSVVHLRWTLEQAHEIATRHIRRALNDSASSLPAFATPPLLDHLQQLIIEEYGHHAPAGWVALAETLLYFCQQQHGVSLISLPLSEAHFRAIKSTFFARHMPLLVAEESHGVWRGHRFIRLDEQPLRFVALLRRRDGRPVNSDDEELFSLAHSKANIHSIASRTRNAIEPLTDQPIYLINKRGAGGYWLENYL
jgi:hypothetical protein